MADHIPFEIQLEIIKRLPLKSLIQFRSVSKTWKSSIDSPHFIARYTGKIVGSCRGLLCLFYNIFYDPLKAVIWNISIRKAIGVVVPNVGGEIYDPKIVKINHISRWTNAESISSIPWQVEIFTLSTGVWRSPNNNLPRKSIQFHGSQVMVDEFLYWHPTDKITMDRSYNLIISFDIKTEEFKEVKLPDTLAHNCPAEHDGVENLCISKLRNSLVVLEPDGVRRLTAFVVVWMMEDGNPKSFAKLFTISKPNASIHSVLEFKNNGEPIIKIAEHREDSLDDWDCDWV